MISWSVVTITRGGHSKSVVGILPQLVTQCPNGNAKNVCRMRPIAKAVFQRINDQITFNRSHSPPNEGGCARSVFCCVLGIDVVCIGIVRGRVIRLNRVLRGC